MTVFKEDLEKSQQRVEAWWRGEVVDRAVILVTAPRADASPYRGPETEDLHTYFTDPAYASGCSAVWACRMALPPPMTPSDTPFTTPSTPLLSNKLKPVNSPLSRTIFKMIFSSKCGSLN